MYIYAGGRAGGGGCGWVWVGGWEGVCVCVSLFTINRPGLFTACDLDLCSVFPSPFFIAGFFMDLDVKKTPWSY